HGAHDGGQEPGHTRKEAQHDDFLPRHQDAEDVTPAEPAHREEPEAVRDFARVDQVQHTGEEAEQPEDRVAREVESEGGRDGSHAIGSYGEEVRGWGMGARYGERWYSIVGP